jgi:hypothetical protein
VGGWMEVKAVLRIAYSNQKNIVKVQISDIQIPEPFKNQIMVCIQFSNGYKMAELLNTELVFRPQYIDNCQPFEY